MIIISQDKKILLNFENTCSISMIKKENKDFEFESDEDERETFDVVALLIDKTIVKLGTYATEGRAKAVLEDLINTISIDELRIHQHNHEVLDLVIKYKKIARYEMPES